MNCAKRRLLRDDRGASAVELAILAPALLVLTMIVIQFALWFQARQAALTAAQEGARIAREYTGSGSSTWKTYVQNRTLYYYDGLGTQILEKPTATPFIQPAANGAPEMAGVTVSGHVNSLLNMFGGITVTVTVEGPLECFHPVQAGGGCG